MKQLEQLPVLYSLRNCPYAMRGRIAIYKSKVPVVLRDIVLSNKPTEMTEVSPKATVPVLVLPNSKVIDESLDVMLWALKAGDPDNLLLSENPENLQVMLSLIQQFDTEFKSALEAYKCAKRYRETNIAECRAVCEQYLEVLEQKLNEHTFIMGEQESLADIALLPFIRQFGRVERQWYLQSPYPKVRQWLNNYLQSVMFSKVMKKHPLWEVNQAALLMF